MSRTLSKVLIVCAMVVLFPLMIVGTAFAAYYSVDATVEVSAYVNTVSVSEDAYAKIVYNNKAKTSFSITEGHLSNIDLTAVTSGYDFIGWFAGDLEGYSISHMAGTVSFVSTETALNINISDYEKLLAVFEIVQYDVRYSYKEQPTDMYDEITTPETNDGDAVSKIYNFGAVLPNLTYVGNDYRFLGWRIVGDSSNTIYDSATFDIREDLVLTAVWQEQGKITVKYYAENKTTVLKEIEVYENQNFTLETPAEILNPSAISDGFRYIWQDKDGNSISEVVNQTRNLDVYLKSQAIVYSAKLNFSDATFNGSNSALADFTILNKSSLEAWRNVSKWATTYSFHQVTGFKYNGTTYSIDNSLNSLASAIIAANPRGSINVIEIETVFTKYFTDFIVDGVISCKTYVGNEDVYRYVDLPYEGEFGSPYKIEILSKKDSTSTIYQLLGLQGSGGGAVSKLYAYNSASNDGDEVQLVKVSVTIGAKTQTYTISGDATINDLIQMILNNNTTIELTETFHITALTALFS